MRVKLVSVDTWMPESTIVLNKLPAVIGRSPDADARRDDPWISRMHCEISEFQGTLFVRDLESRNGTLVNGEHVTRARLLPGDRLTLGTATFKVRYKRSKSKAPLRSREASGKPEGI